MGTGYDFLREAEKYIGQSEDPRRPNRSGGPVIDACQTASGYNPLGVPWCGCYVLYCAKRSRYKSYIDIGHGYTGYTYQRAGERGWLKKGGADTPPGSLFIMNGRHVGIVRSSGPGYFTTYEGNASDACRSLTRAWADGWSAIVPPDLGTSADGTRTVFGWEDLNVKPARFGGWKSKDGRDARMAQWWSRHPHYWVRPIRIATEAPYAFEAGLYGTDGKRYDFGPYDTKAERDAKLAGWKRLHHDNVRIYSKKINGTVPTGAGASGVGKVD